MGIGVSICHRETGQEVEAISESIGHGTNNVAEFVAIKRAVMRAKSLGAVTLEVRSDSQLIIRQLTGEYGCHDQRLAGIREDVLIHARGFERITWTWIPRERNQRADELSKLTTATPDPYASIVTPQVVEHLLSDRDRRAPALPAVVAAFLRRGDWSSAAFLGLKSGRDAYSTLSQDEAAMVARVRHGDAALDAMLAHIAGWKPTKQRDILRWAARGLPPGLALRRQRVLDESLARFRP